VDHRILALGFSSVIVLIVLPAYLMYIVPTMHRLEEAHKSEESQRRLEEAH